MLRTTEKISNLPGVYVILNEFNGKFYIGSSKNLYQRFINHRALLNSNKHGNDFLQKSFNAHPESFVFYLYEYTDNFKTKEQELLDQWYDNKKNCYNISFKVDQNTIIKSQEWRAATSVRQIEYFKKNEKARFALTNSMGSQKARENFKKIIRTEEFRQKLITGIKEKKAKDWNVWLFNVITNEEVFLDKNLNEFAKNHKLTQSNLLSVVRGNRMKHKGFILLSNKEWWLEQQNQSPKKYVDQGIMPLSQRLKLSEAKQKVWNIWFENIETGKKLFVGSNLRLFCLINGLDKGAIQRVIKKQSSHHKGWRLIQQKEAQG